MGGATIIKWVELQLGGLNTCTHTHTLSLSQSQGNLAKASSTMDWGVLQAKAISLHSAMRHNVDKLKSVGLQDVIESAVTSYVMSDRVSYIL